jgi:hypothetical protein
MAEAVLKPQYGAKEERRQLQRTCGTAAVRAPDAGIVGWAKGPEGTSRTHCIMAETLR